MISLVILVVMTLLGVGAMTGSGLQERMVGNQKQAIEASMAAEAGAIEAVRWLRAHPEAWGDAEAWKADDALPSRVPSTPNFGEGGAVYWIERLSFAGDVATVVSRGGVLAGPKVMGQSVVTVALQKEPDGTDSAPGENEGAEDGESERDDYARRLEGRMPAATGSTVEFVGLNAPSASAGVKTEPDPTTASDAVGQADHVAMPDDSSQARRIRGRVIFWRQSAASTAGSDRK
jgi:hypothetical protein